MIDKTVRLGLLLDFYGPLLTEKQRRCFSLYHQEDMSLGEIAEEFGVTRQAVFDILQRTQKTLLELEGRLGLEGRYSAQKAELNAIDGRLGELIAAISSLNKAKILQELETIRQLVREMLAGF